jgi:hypothetical protein
MEGVSCRHAGRERKRGGKRRGGGGGREGGEEGRGGGTRELVLSCLIHAASWANAPRWGEGRSSPTTPIYAPKSPGKD